MRDASHFLRVGSVGGSLLLTIALLGCQGNVQSANSANGVAPEVSKDAPAYVKSFVQGLESTPPDQRLAKVQANSALVNQILASPDEATSNKLRQLVAEIPQGAN